MALIDTKRRGMYFDGIPDLVCKLRETLMDELDAANTYEELACNARCMGYRDTDEIGQKREIPGNKLSVEDAGNLAVIFERIRDEEISHSTVLLNLMGDLEPKFKEYMKKGLGAL